MASRRSLPSSSYVEDAIKQSQHFFENAENCAQLAERATVEPTHVSYKRMEADAVADYDFG